tara:strand:- start:198 stop:752 length:555 start_codon:yes stop_codon:yes gene_type:complete
MALETPICDFGRKSIDFKLKATDGNYYTYNSIKGQKATLVMFICNHCPYVRSIILRLVDHINILKKEGVGIAAIMSNDTKTHPDDSFENMIKFSKKNNFTFPYLIDTTQEVAKSYRAVCTPDFFGFNDKDELQYRGRLDESKKDLVVESSEELLNAMRQIIQTGHGPKKQIPSMGCSIKWRQAS